MITREHAAAAIQKWLDSDIEVQRSFGGWVVVDSKTIERPYGWAFAKATKQYLETKNPTRIPAGNSAILCLKHSRECYLLGSALSTADYLKSFENDSDGFLRKFRLLGTISSEEPKLNLI